MDILGTDNTFVKHRIVPAQVKYPWANKTRSTMRLVRERVEMRTRRNWLAVAFDLPLPDLNRIVLATEWCRHVPGREQRHVRLVSNRYYMPLTVPG